MRVLVVNHECSRSGAPKVAGVIAEAFVAAGDEAILVNRWGGPLERELSANATTAIREPMRWLKAALGRRQATRGMARRVERWAAAKVIRSTRPDLVWCNTIVSALYARPAAAAGIPAVVHLHEIGSYVAQLNQRWPLDDLLAGPSAVHLVACSTAVADAALNVWPQPAHVLHTPLTVASTPVRSLCGSSELDRAVVIGCGQSPQAKGLDRFAATAARVSAERHDVEFVWVGAVIESDRDASPGVRFLGARPDAAAHIADATVFVSAGRADPFPIVVLEAMAGGTPVVAFDSGGAPEQLGDTGLVVADGDIEAMASAVITLLDDPARRAALADAARQRVDQLWSREAFSVKLTALSRRLAATTARAVRNSQPPLP